MTKLPPHLCDLDAERAVLGSMILGGRAAIDDAFDLVTATDFTDDWHRGVAAAIALLDEEGKPPEVALIASTLRATGFKPDLSRVLALTETIATEANVRHFAGRVRDKRRVRDLCTAAQSVLRLASETKPVDELVSEAQAALLEAGAESARSPVVWANEIAAGMWREMETTSDAKALPGVMTGFGAIDSVGGLRPKEVMVVAGRPGSGKTAFVQNLLLNIAERGGRALLVSLEMALNALAYRWTAMRARVNTLRLEKSFSLDADEWTQAGRAISKFSELPIGAIEESFLDINTLRTTIRRIHRRTPLAVVGVDYLQLMSGAKGVRREEQISEISRGIKNLAHETGIPFVSLSQLNRKCEERTDEKGRRGVPQLSDLRESGSIEQDAASVVMLYRQQRYHEEADPNAASLLITKHRYAPLGEYPLRFDARYQHFYEGAR